MLVGGALLPMAALTVRGHHGSWRTNAATKLRGVSERNRVSDRAAGRLMEEFLLERKMQFDYIMRHNTVGDAFPNERIENTLTGSGELSEEEDMDRLIAKVVSRNGEFSDEENRRLLLVEEELNLAMEAALEEMASSAISPIEMNFGFALLKEVALEATEAALETTAQIARQQTTEYPNAYVPVQLPTNDRVLQKMEAYRVKTIQLIAEGKGSNLESVGGGWPSPFGPVSSASCYEELTDCKRLRLTDLSRRVGSPEPQTKVLLSIVSDPVVFDGVLTAVAADDAGQYVLLKVHGTTFGDSTDGAPGFSIRSRFFLKNPHLVLSGGYPLLRVDQPFDLLPLNVPPLHGRILLVGEGDFSFARSLAENDASYGEAAEIHATSLASRAAVTRLYAKAEENLRVLHSMKGVRVSHGVNATKDISDMDGPWDSIMWNFPYPENTNRAPRTICKPLMAGFLKQAKDNLSEGGKIYVTLNPLQGGTTREAACKSEAWGMDQLAHEHGLDLVEVVPFNFDEFSTYEPRRGFNDTTFPSNNAKVHILGQHARNGIPGASPSQRSVMSGMAGVVLDRTWRRQIKAAPWTETIQILMSQSKNSTMVQNLIKACQNLGLAMEMLNSLERIDFDKGKEKRFLNTATHIVSLLSEVYKVRYGDNIAAFYVDQLEALIEIVYIVMLLLPMRAEDSDHLEDLLDQEGPPFAALALLAEIPTHEKIEFETVKTVKITRHDCIYVLCSLWFAKDDRVGQNMFTSALRIEPDSLLFTLRKLDCIAIELAEERISPGLKLLEDLVRQSENLLQKVHENESLSLEVTYLLAWFLEYVVLLSGSPREGFKIEKALGAYEDYISGAEVCDRMLPQAHYHAGVLCILGGSPATKYLDQSRARKHYVQGLEAEKSTLPIFEVSPHPLKRLLSTLLMVPRASDKKKKRENQREVTPITPINAKTRENIQTLLEQNPAGIKINSLRQMYQETFEDPFPVKRRGDVLDMMKGEAKSGFCTIASHDKCHRIFLPSPVTSSFQGEVTVMLEAQSLIQMSEFRKIYWETFKKKVPYKGKALLGALKKYEESSSWILNKAGSLIELKSETPVLDKMSTFEEIENLVTSEPMPVSNLKDRYKTMFGNELNIGTKKVGAFLRKAAAAGHCRVLMNGTTMLVSSVPRPTKSSTKNEPNIQMKSETLVIDKMSTFEEIENLVTSEPMPVSYLKDRYKTMFGNELNIGTKKVGAFLRKAAAAGHCRVWMNGTAMWVSSVPRTTKSSTKKEPKIQMKSETPVIDKMSTFEEIENLVTSEPMSVSNLKDRYKAMFGKDLNIGKKKVGAFLRKAAAAGHCRVWMNGTTMLVSSVPRPTKSSIKNESKPEASSPHKMSTYGEIQSLLTSEPMNASTLKSRYQSMFGKDLNIGGKKLGTFLQKAAASGHCKVWKDGTTMLISSPQKKRKR